MKLLSKRASGILMHISSLPGKTGIGTLGNEAYKFVDYLADCHQTYWQVLPLGQTGYGDSPYQSFSVYAGNPYFIDLEALYEQGLIDKEDVEKVNWSKDEHYVDYGLLYTERYKIFYKVLQNFTGNMPSAYEKFCKENEYWLNDYALFMAVKNYFGGKALSDWDRDILKKDEQAIEKYSELCSKDISLYKMLQYLFYEQWFKLKEYANSKGVRIIGDIPIYVSSDSCDVWSCPEVFDLSEELKPNMVAGCPPDAFTSDGQLWGNPVYNWDYLKKHNYQWWIKRLKYNLSIYDVLRIDHFRGFEAFYCIPYGDKTARNGIWKKACGIDFFDCVKNNIGDCDIIAEDLGFLTDEVKELLQYTGFPGMKVLQFAFDSEGGGGKEYLPHNYTKNSIVYTGTHDNDTLEGWIKNSKKGDVQYAAKYIGCKIDNLRPMLIKKALESVCSTCILTIQDIIGKGNEARMNMPSSVGRNWQWRVTEDELYNCNFTEKLKEYTDLYERS